MGGRLDAGARAGGCAGARVRSRHSERAQRVEESRSSRARETRWCTVPLHARLQNSSWEATENDEGTVRRKTQSCALAVLRALRSCCCTSQKERVEDSAQRSPPHPLGQQDAWSRHLPGRGAATLLGPPPGELLSGSSILRRRIVSLFHDPRKKSFGIRIQPLSAPRSLAVLCALRVPPRPACNSGARRRASSRTRAPASV